MAHVPVNKFMDPAEDFLVTEWHADWNLRLANGAGCIIYWGYFYYGNFGSPTPNLPPVDGNYHGSGNNYLFVDGHAALLTPSEATTGVPGLENTWARRWNWKNLD